MKSRVYPIGSRPVLRVVLAVVVGVTVAGCYTVLTHPGIGPAEQVTSSGTVIDEANCGGCHTARQLWSYHHAALNDQRTWYRGDDPYNRWEYYYNPYDGFFARDRWYGRSYYRDWAYYYHRSWWSLGYASRAMVKAVTDDGEEAVGRGASRDGADRVRSRQREFVDLFPPQTLFGPMGGGQPVTLSVPTSSARAAADSAAAAESTGRTPTTVRQRYPSSPPVQTSAPEQPASARTATEKKKDDDDEEASSSSTGRGARRRSSGSRSR